MNRYRTLIPWLVLAALWAVFAGYVWNTSQHLPERVATHFGAGGQPNGWMTRSGLIQFTLVTGLVVPGFIFGIFALMRYMQAGLNVPNKEYRPESRAFLQRHGLWFAGLFLLFLGGMHYTVLSANTRAPITLSNAEIGWVSGSFSAGMAVWIAVLFLHFIRKPA